MFILETSRTIPEAILANKDSDKTNLIHVFVTSDGRIKYKDRLEILGISMELWRQRFMSNYLGYDNIMRCWDYVMATDKRFLVYLSFVSLGGEGELIDGFEHSVRYKRSAADDGDGLQGPFRHHVICKPKDISKIASCTFRRVHDVDDVHIYF